MKKIQLFFTCDGTHKKTLSLADWRRKFYFKRSEYGKLISILITTSALAYMTTLHSVLTVDCFIIYHQTVFRIALEYHRFLATKIKLKRLPLHGSPGSTDGSMCNIIKTTQIFFTFYSWRSKTALSLADFRRISTLNILCKAKLFVFRRPHY